MEKNFVTFYSPGSFVAETTTKEIDNWDVDTAVAMSKGIKERYGATPYGFQFIKKTRGDNDLDSKISERSNMYYLGGDILTVEDLKKEDPNKNSILISNMECNRWNRVVRNNNSYCYTRPLEEGDVVLDV